MGMASQSPPKPWERAGAASGSASASMSAPLNTTATAASSSSDPSQPPALPSKPASLTSVVNRTASNYSPYGATPGYGSSLYGGIGTGMGGYGAYSSPYSRFGSMYGGYGSMYGMGMGGGMGGGMYGGMGGYGAPGMMGGDPNSLTNAFNQNTQATFQIIESVVGAFGGFAQMLESTYMATHQSFFAMISVAEQFSNLRDTLGSILGIFAILRWIRTLLAKVTGRPPPADATSLTPAAFAKFQGQPVVLPDGTPAPPRPSKKPFVVFLLAAFGLPYLMGKFIRALAKSQDEAAQRQNLVLGPDGRPLPPDQQPPAIDPSQLDFCRLKYDFTPENAANPTPGIDLQVKKGDVVAVLAKTDPLGNASEWWKCRSRDGHVGYLPGPYLEVIKRTPKQLTQGSSAPASLAHTVTSGEASRSHTMKTDGAVSTPPDLKSKVGDISVESFQKSQFYS